MKRTISFLLVFLMLFLLHTAAMALDTSSLWIHDSSGNLGTYNIDADTVTVIGNMGAVMTDIAFDPYGNLFGITFTGLYSIDSTNANATYIGNHSISGGNALVFGPDGTLYGAGSNTISLFSIDTTTGSGSVLGTIGYFSAGDLAFKSGSFYLAADTSGNDTLVKINQSTYAGTAVGRIGHDNVYGLSTGDDGNLYGLSGTNVLSIDNSTGVGTIIGNYAGAGIGTSYGSSFIGESCTSVEITSITLDQAESINVGDIITYTVDASDTNENTIYYKFFYHANYGTNDYDISPWVVVQDYSTTNSCNFTFSSEGNYIVVVRTVTDPNNEPEDLPIIGGVIPVGSGDNILLTSLTSDATGDIYINDTVMYTVNGSNLNNDPIYYKWFYRANYGTSDYDSSPWVVVQDYSANSSCNFSFQNTGKYIIVVRAVTDPNYEPPDLPIIGGVVSVK